MMRTRKTRSAVGLIAGAAMTTAAQAQTKTWQGGAENDTTNWNNAVNWDPDGVPTASDTVVLTNNFGSAVIINAPATAQALQFNSGSAFTLFGQQAGTLTGVRSITTSPNTTGRQSINLPQDAGGSLLFPAGDLTITNNAAATAATNPLLVFESTTVIGTPGSGALVFDGTGTTAFNGSTAVPSTLNHIVGGITKNGTGTLVFGGNGTSLTGGLKINRGTVRLDFSANSAAKFNGTFFSTAGELQLIRHASTAINQSTSGTTLTSGHTNIDVSGDGSGAVTLGLGIINTGGQRTLNVTGSGPFTVTTAGGNTRGLMGTGPAFATFNGRWAAISGGAITGVNGTANTFAAGVNTDLTSTQAPSFTTTNSIRFAANNVAVDGVGVITVQSGGFLVPSGTIGSVVHTGRYQTAGEFFIHAYGPLTINADLSNDAGGLTKTGPERLTLAGDNFFLNGPILLNRGSLTVTKIRAVDRVSGITMADPFEFSDLTFDLAADSTFDKPIMATPTTIGGQVVKDGTGTLTLTASNNFDGLTLNAGTLRIAGANDLRGDHVVVHGTATLLVTGGGSLNNSRLGSVGGGNSANNSAVVGGGTGASLWSSFGDIEVGGFGVGRLDVIGGGTVTSARGLIGAHGGTGTATVGGGTGAAAWTNSGEMRVGDLGNGTLNVVAGGTVSSAVMNVGNAAGGNGTVNVGGSATGVAAMTTSGALTVGEAGLGTLNVTAGGTVTSGTGVIGNATGGDGTVNVGGGIGPAAWNNTTGLTVGVAGAGRLNLLPSGTVSTPGLAGGNAASGVNFDGGTLRVTATDTASNTFNVLPRNGAIELPTAGSTFTHTGALAGGGTLTKTGPGTLVLNGTGTNFTGGVTVNAGRLDVPSEAALGTATLATGPGGTIRYTAATPTTARTFNLAGQLEVPGQVLTLSGATINGGFLVGSGVIATQAGSANTFAGNTTAPSMNLSLAGTDSLTNVTHGGSLTKPAGSTATLTRFTNTSSGRMDVSGGLSVSDFVSNGRITINGGGTVTQTNASTAAPLTLGGGSVTTVNVGGTLNLGASGSQQVGRLAGGLLVNNGTVNGGRLVVDFGGLARGTGTYEVNPLTVNGGRYSPGSSPGRGNVGTFIADANGTYDFEINDGSPGGEGPTGEGPFRGWDLLTIRNDANSANSAFVVEATPTNRFTINLVTLAAPSPSDTAGLDDFDPNVTQQWLAFQVDPDATNAFPNGFNSDAFAINTTGFLNTFNGTFALTRTGNDLFVTYTPVPEPGAAAVLLGLGGLIAGRRVRRCRRVLKA
jgi:fibronectin-binding autotransporter adhesin